MNECHEFTLLPNPGFGPPEETVLPEAEFARARAAIIGWDGYAPTHLLDLPDLAQKIGVGSIRLKHEGTRFGLGSFKALGGGYAVERLVAETAISATGLADKLTVTCATDGNHGRAVAWAAQRGGCRCVIFVHAGVSQGRVDAIAHYGAEVIRVAGTYDDAVREADRQAMENGWFVVSDTSYPGYTEIPRHIMQGYRLMADEALAQWTGQPPTHVFIQAGVGGVAAAVSVHMRQHCSPSPMLVVAEPDRAACFLASAKAGAPTAVDGALDTVMAGLACGEVSALAWQELARAAAAFIALPDQAAIETMRDLAALGIEVGESGVAGLAALRLAAADERSRRVLRLSAESRVLTFATEGITDPVVYRCLLG